MRFFAYLLIVLGVLCLLIMPSVIIDGFADHEDRSGLVFGGIIMALIGVLLIWWGRWILKQPKNVVYDNLSKGLWTTRCSWFLFAAIATGCVGVVGWLSLPPAGFMGTLLSFKFFHSTYTAYRRGY